MPLFSSTPHPRYPLGVNQIVGGNDYPFTNPSEDVAFLLGDAYLGYMDSPGTFEPPFRVTWLYGFGSVSNSPPDGAPTPTHDFDLVIKDNNDQVVFDSTTAIGYQVNGWNDWLEVIQWQTASAVCRVTRYTSWALDQTPIPFTVNIAPTNGVLDGRICGRLPRQVLGIKVGNTVYTGQAKLVAGYNLKLATDLINTDGGRYNPTVLFQAEPGAGLGQFPGCESPSGALRRVNGQGPDVHGNFVLDAVGCYRLQMKAQISSLSPRQATPTPGTLQFFNDCGPCCDCDDYVNTYKGLQNVWNQYHSIDVDAHKTRDLINENLIRWNAQKLCRDAKPLRMLTGTFQDCSTAFAAQWCNTGDDCVGPVSLKFTFEYSGTYGVTGAIDPNSTVINGIEQYAMGGHWPVYKAQFANVDPNGHAAVRFRLNFSGCKTGDHLLVKAEAVLPKGHTPPEPLTKNIPMLPHGKLGKEFFP